MTEFVIIKEDSPEWNYMRERLEAHPLNEGLVDPYIALNPLNDYQWRYLSSMRNNGVTIHTFEHKSHPSNNDRVSYSFYASKDMNEADILNKFPVK